MEGAYSCWSDRYRALSGSNPVVGYRRAVFACPASFALAHRQVRSKPHITVDHEHRQWEARVFLFSGVSIQSHLQFRTAALRIYCSRY